MSVLLPESRASLKTVRPSGPFFSNMILGEQFENAHSRGPYKILPYALGGYVVFRTDAPNGKGVVGNPYLKIEDAQRAMEALP